MFFQFMTDTRRWPPMLQPAGLTPRCSPLVSWECLSLKLGSGRFVALLGRDGTDKSKFFKVLLGLFAADEEVIDLAGRSLRRSATAGLRHIGVVFRQASFDLNLGIGRNMLQQATRHGLPPRLATDRIGARVAWIGIDGNFAREVREWSAGSTRKAELMRASPHRSSALVSDEPTMGRAGPRGLPAAPHNTYKRAFLAPGSVSNSSSTTSLSSSLARTTSRAPPIAWGLWWDA